jgi:hypothetical protein
MSTMSGRFLAMALLVSPALFLVACGKPQVTGPETGGPPGSPSGPAGSGGAAGGGGSGPGFELPPVADAGADSGGSASNPPVGESCAEEAHDGKMVPVDLLFLVDISGSMEESAGAQSKWVALRDALSTFVRDPKSAGLGAGLLFFPPPSKRCAMDGECGAASGVCEQKGVCAEPANVATTEAACNHVQECLGSVAPCTVYGLCSRSGLRCTAMGQACPGGLAGDTCTARPKLCVDDRTASCLDASYETPVVPIGDLPSSAAAMTDTLALTIPQGSTPTGPAVRGALAHLRARAAANPLRKPVLVLATDGLPSGCDAPALNPASPSVMALSAARMATPAVNSYVIGVFAQAQLGRALTTLNSLATAGGTGSAFVLMTGTDLSQRFLEAVNQIRGTALGCEFIIPPPTRGTIDFEKVNVRYTGPAGTEDLRYVGSSDRCDAARGGWYYDVDPAGGRPARVLLCPATCTRVKDTAGVSVQLRFGCKTRVD